MLAKRIIPCLDVTGGRVVKGVNFVGLRDAGDPVAIAARYNEQGADELTFLDITATSDGRDMMLHIVEAVAAQVFIPLTVGGGVRTVEDVRRLLNAGADKVSFNSAAVANPQVIADASRKYGAQCIVVAIDAKQRLGAQAAVARRGLGRVHARRAQEFGSRRPHLGAANGARRRRRTAVDEHGPGRHEKRLRPGVDARRERRGERSRDRLGRRGNARTFIGRNPPWPRRRRARREYFSLRRIHGGASEGAARARRYCGASMSAASRRELPHAVRIIGGQWKRSKLPVPNLLGLRPTPSRVRETLFNWLGQDLSGRHCLDAFAGSGALGFEAASRNAASVVLLERERGLAQGLVASRDRLGAIAVRVENAEAIGWMRACQVQRFDLVFLDPPFDAGLTLPALECAARLLNAAGIVYLESGRPIDMAALSTLGWRMLRHAHAGQVHFALLQRDPPLGDKLCP